jgi:hypothetical protein
MHGLAALRRSALDCTGSSDANPTLWPILYSESVCREGETRRTYQAVNIGRKAL